MEKKILFIIFSVVLISISTQVFAEDDLDALHTKKESLTDRQHYFDLATTLLRDQGVRQRIIKQYVPVMN